jgi:hypothetical protein
MGTGVPRTDGKPAFVTAPRMLTMAGGEPAWLTTATTDERSNGQKPPGYSYFNSLAIPWAQLSIVLRVDSAAQQRFIDTVRTTPEHDGRLVLPRSAAAADLSTPALNLRNVADAHGRTTDPDTIAGRAAAAGPATPSRTAGAPAPPKRSRPPDSP